MARDRQRAKQRRRRQDGAHRPHAPREQRLDELAEDAAAEGTTPGSHRDAGLEDVVDAVLPLAGTRRLGAVLAPAALLRALAVAGHGRSIPTASRGGRCAACTTCSTCAA